MSEYTKGMWITSVHDDNADIVVRTRIDDSGYEPIVANCSVDSVDQIVGDEITANARLMAAAPDLLTACEAMRDEFRALDLCYGSKAYDLCVNTINKTKK